MIIRAFNYKIWADELTLRAIDHIDNPTFCDSYKFIVQQINHIVMVKELFKSRLTGSPVPHQNTNSYIVPKLDELKGRPKESNKWYQRYISDVDDETKLAVLPFTFADGRSGSMSVEEILFHIVNHSSYHRGAIAHALDLADVSHPSDGYGIYVHEKEPVRRLQD